MKSTMYGKLQIMTMSVIIALGMMMTSCTTGSGEQNITLSETNGASAVVGEHEDEAVDKQDGHEENEHEAEAEMLMLPELTAAELGSELLRVVATSSIIGDVVAQVGGDTIDLTVLMGPGQDPHSYEPAARDLTAVFSADVIFINGWDLEESLVDNLENIGEEAHIIPISANIAPLNFAEDQHEHEGEETEHEEEEEHKEGEYDHHSGADPHVWFNIHNVEQWVENVAHVLTVLDPANAKTYKVNTTAYRATLEELEAYAEAQFATIPAENRFLVTNHDVFGYFAEEYGFTVLGTVIPNMSTLAEPSARDLTDMITEMEEHSVCTIFTETTVNDTLAQMVASELSGCGDVQVLKLYTGAIGPEGSGADSYIGMFRANVDAIVFGLNRD